MITKRANFSLIEIEPLNNPSFKDSVIRRQNLVVNASSVLRIQKMASSKEANIEVDGDNTSFDLEAEIKNHPDSLFVKCFAIKADEQNDNGDFFSYSELKRATATFVGVPVFTNHQNTDINEARGKVIHSWWDEDKNGIMIIARVDSVAYPDLARGIKEEYVAGTSMGASRGHDLVTMNDHSKVRVDELQIGDEVFTHTGKVEKVVAICETQEHSKLHHIKWSGNKSGLALSYEHPVLILKREDLYLKTVSGKEYRKSPELINKEANPEFVVASEVKHNDYVLELIERSPEIKKPKYDSFFYGPYIAHRIKNVSIIDNSEPTYYVQVGENNDNDSDHSYILNDIATHNCQVKFSICSACHNYAETPDSYCSCVRERKTRVASLKNQKCNYFKHGNEKECPLCSSTKNDIKTFDYNGPIFEHNYGIKFIENSFVVNPACSDCGVTEVIDPQKFLSKVAHIQKVLPGLIKEAKANPLSCTDQSCMRLINNETQSILENAMQYLNKGAESVIKSAGVDFLKYSITNLMKDAGQKEIDDLNNALNLITSVSQSMLSQKDQIDLEFLGDTVQVLADLQDVVDELTEQGYGRLPSPEGTPAGQDPASQTTQQPATTQPAQATPTSDTSKVQSGPAGDVGTVTGPLANKQINLEKLSNLISKNKRINFKNKKSNNLINPKFSILR